MVCSVYVKPKSIGQERKLLFFFACKFSYFW
jgi:hypothetical protein